MSNTLSSGARNLEPVAPGEDLVTKVYRQLHELVVRGDLAAGTHLSVPELARRLETSRSPVREAVAMLANDGLVLIQPRKGAAVVALDADELVEIYHLREVLDGLAGRLAAERASPEALAAMMQTVEQHAGDSGENVRVRLNLDQAFHRQIAHASGNPRLRENLDRLQAQFRTGMERTRHFPGERQRSIDEHRAIAAAIADRDGDLAETLARQHVARLRWELVERKEKGN